MDLIIGVTTKVTVSKNRTRVMDILTKQKMGAKKHQHQPIHGLIRNPSMFSMSS